MRAFREDSVCPVAGVTRISTLTSRRSHKRRSSSARAAASVPEAGLRVKRFHKDAVRWNTTVSDPKMT